MQSIQAQDGAKITYIDTLGVPDASGPTLVFLHGIMGGAASWKRPIRLLQDAYRCVAIDMRGHGASGETSGLTIGQYAKDTQEVIEHLGLKRVVLVGFSLGGLTAFEYIARYGSHRLEKLVICDMTPKMISDEAWPHGLYRGEYHEADFAFHEVNGEARFHTEAAYFTYRDFTKPPRRGFYRKTPPLWSRILERFIFSTPKIKHATFVLFKDACGLDHRETLKKIDVKTALFYADPGSLFTPETAFHIAKHIPGGAVLAPFEGASHLTMLSPPKRFAAELRRFID